MSSAQLQPGSAMPSDHIVSIRQLADTLYHSTLESPHLINQAQNELSLLLSVLSTAEAYSSNFTSKDCLPALSKTLQRCHQVLLDLQRLQRSPNSLGPQSQITNIRAVLSCCIFDLSALNSNMMKSSQNKIVRMPPKSVDEVPTGQGQASLISNTSSDLPSIIVSNASRDLPSINENEDERKKLQAKLERAAITSEHTKDRELIITALQKPLGEKNVEGNYHLDSRSVETRSDQDESLLDNSSRHSAVAQQEKGYSDKELTVQEKSHPDKNVLPREIFPIPLASEMGMSDSEKQALPPKDSLPIPVAVEARSETDSNKQALPKDNFPIPAVAQIATPLTEKKSRVAEGKKANRMSKMLYRISHSHDNLFRHIVRDDFNSVKRELDRGANVDVESHNGATALMVATSYGYENMVKLLLDNGAAMNKVSLSGDCALGVAAGRGFERIILLLLENGADPNAANDHQKAPLALAAAYGYERIVQVLLVHGADVNNLSSPGDTALGQAAMYGHENVARLLLAKGAMVDKAGYRGMTPLYKAIAQGHSGMARLLLANGANPRLEHIQGVSALSLATMKNNRDITKVLADYGYDIVEYW